MKAPIKTPELAEQRGDRWRFWSIVVLVGAAVLAMFGLGNLSWLMVAVSLLCSQEAADHYGWRRGYLAREREERQDAETAGERRG